MVMARIDRKIIPPPPPPPPPPKLEKAIEGIGKKAGEIFKKTKIEGDLKEIGGAIKKSKLELGDLGGKIGDIFDKVGEGAKEVGGKLGKIFDKLKEGKITSEPPFKCFPMPEGGIKTLAAGIEQGGAKPGGKPEIHTLAAGAEQGGGGPIKLPGEAIEAIKDFGSKIF